MTENSPQPKDELIATATSSAMGRVMEAAGSSDQEIQDAYHNGLVPEGVDGDLALRVNIQLREGMGVPLSPEQSKWFALGVAAQANATHELRQHGIGQISDTTMSSVEVTDSSTPST